MERNKAINVYADSLMFVSIRQNRRKISKKKRRTKDGKGGIFES